LYEQDMQGKMVYEHDIVCANGVYTLAFPPMPKKFKIVGNIHTTWIPAT
jgi:hypothetical protein